jgi:hypothetical protein
MGNLSHVLRRSDTSIAVSRLPHSVTGGVESCGSPLRRNFCGTARIHKASELTPQTNTLKEEMSDAILLRILINVYCRDCSVGIGTGKKSGKIEKGECDLARRMHPLRW